MSDAENPIHPLPDAKGFLEGKDGIKPLHHKADALQKFTAGFEEIPLKPKAAESLVRLGEVVKNQEWAEAHDAAHRALLAARKLVTDNPSEELASHAYSVEGIFNARAPNVDTVKKGVKHPILEEALKPLANYLEEFGHFVTGWARLSPSGMKPKGEDAITPSSFRATMQNEEPHVHGPDCGHDHDHAPTDSAAPHDHSHGGDGHNHAAHGSGHNHSHDHSGHDHPSGGHSHGEPHDHAHGHSAKAGWIFAAVAAVTAGVFLFDRYRKKKKEKEGGEATLEEHAKRDAATVARSKLPPAEREKQKTARDKAEDIAYTVNHSLACLASDFVTNPLFSTLIQKTLNKHSHVHHDHGIFGHTVVGEVAGDLLAVAPTVAMQRFFPSFMDGIRRMLEPVLGGLFRKGAERTSRQWATKNGVDVTSDVYKNHVKAVYQHEISHLPQALMWSASSMAINIASQKLSGNKNPVWQIAAGTAGGIAATAALVVGARAVAPDVAEDWDEFTSKRLLLPVTKTVDKALGVNRKKAAELAEKEATKENGSWTGRTKDSPDQPKSQERSVFDIKEKDVNRMAEEQKKFENPEWAERVKDSKTEIER